MGGAWAPRTARGGRAYMSVQRLLHLAPSLMFDFRVWLQGGLCGEHRALEKSPRGAGPVAGGQEPLCQGRLHALSFPLTHPASASSVALFCLGTSTPATSAVTCQWPRGCRATATATAQRPDLDHRGAPLCVINSFICIADALGPSSGILEELWPPTHTPGRSPAAVLPPWPVCPSGQGPKAVLGGNAGIKEIPISLSNLALF